MLSLMVMAVAVAVTMAILPKEKKMYEHMRTFCTEYEKRQLVLDAQEKKSSESIQKKNLLPKSLRRQILSEVESGKRKYLTRDELKKHASSFTDNFADDCPPTTSSTEEKDLPAHVKMGNLIYLCAERFAELGNSSGVDGFSQDKIVGII